MIVIKHYPKVPKIPNFACHVILDLTFWKYLTLLRIYALRKFGWFYLSKTIGIHCMRDSIVRGRSGIDGWVELYIMLESRVYFVILCEAKLYFFRKSILKHIILKTPGSSTFIVFFYIVWHQVKVLWCDQFWH